MLASSLLARIYYTQSTSEQEPEKLAELKDLTLDSYMQAIALGSTEAMYNLANLYISNYYGEENAEAALPLLEQAAALGADQAPINIVLDQATVHWAPKS